MRVFLLVLLLPGCADISVVAGGELHSNFATLEHPFTEDGAARARAQADALCGHRKQAAYRTESACTASKCFTTYQCSSEAPR